MKIHISYPFQEGPWGGGNQFLKALKKEFRKQEIYEENPEKAEAILFNSFHNLGPCYKIKQKHPEKIIIYRIDGPISFVRGRGKEIDEIIALFNKLFADGIISQSNWSREQNKKYFNISSKYEVIIHNGPDNEIFNRSGKKEFNLKEKIKLVVTSWSSNWRKGFAVYKFLDENLDFSKYQMTFVGNSPIEFKNINWIKPVPPEKLAEILKEQDIYIIASQNDPCSNALIEALSCGLPAVTLNNGGHPELMREGGELFDNKNDLIEKIERVAENYHYYQSRIPRFSIKNVAQDYFQFTQKIYEDMLDGKYKPKPVNLSAKINLNIALLKGKGLSKLRRVKEKLWPV